MTERPILFSAPMVLALLAGTKTQTRRLVNPQPEGERGLIRMRGMGGFAAPHVAAAVAAGGGFSPYGVPGDELWVREKWGHRGTMWRSDRPEQREVFVEYCNEKRSIVRPAKDDSGLPKQRCLPRFGKKHSTEQHYDECLETHWKRWVPSIHMPRWASRIVLQVTEVRVERLNAITEADAIAEGIERSPGGPWRSYDRAGGCCYLAADSYGSLWESINGPGSWAANPWVWAITFKAVTP